MPTVASPYHHGNLRQSLLDCGLQLLREQGIARLSLRQLAERCAVSRSAPYHHFTDKQALLAALAAQGFSSMREQLSTYVQDGIPSDEALLLACLDYLDFALQQPALYELMFGSLLWRDSDPTRPDTARFQRLGKDCFRQYVQLFAQRPGASAAHSLRQAQLLWASLHGLAKLALDGIFVKREDLGAIVRQALLVACTDDPSAESTR